MTAVATTAGVSTGERKGLPVLFERPTAVERITPFLPKGVTYDRVVAQALMEAKKNPEILQCTPDSIITAIAKSQAAGLEIGDTAHLVPFNVKVSKKGEADAWEKRLQFIADYKGLAQLMIRGGAVRAVDPECVYEKEMESFIYEKGSHPRIVHYPITHGDRGALAGAYVILRLPFQQWIGYFMRIDEIDAIRKRYSKSWKNDECPPWYAKKTVIRQSAKLWPKDPRLAGALAQIEEEEAIETAGHALDPEREIGNGAKAAIAPAPAQPPVDIPRDADGVALFPFKPRQGIALNAIEHGAFVIDEKLLRAGFDWSTKKAKEKEAAGDAEGTTKMLLMANAIEAELTQRMPAEAAPAKAAAPKPVKPAADVSMAQLEGADDELPF